MEVWKYGEISVELCHSVRKASDIVKKNGNNRLSRKENIIKVIRIFCRFTVRCPLLLVVAHECSHPT